MRAGPPLRLSVLLALAAACYYAVFAFYPALFWMVGVNDYGVWFLDTFAILASNDAVTRGLDPYAVNPLDYFGRPHVYSHWWLHLRDLGLTRAHNFWVGLGLVGAFLVAAVARLRPSEPRQVPYYLAVLCASPVLLAVNRANNDLVVFLVLAPLVACLLDARGTVRLLAPFLVAVAAGLKFYPAAAGLVLLAAAPARELRLRIALALGLLLLVGLGIRGELAGFGPIAPKPEGLLSFGATAAFNALGWTGWMPKAVAAALGLAAFVAFWRWRGLEEWSSLQDKPADRLAFVLGAVLLTGCFFTSLNFAYRWVFALWLAPMLWWLPAHAAVPAAVRDLARLTRALLFAVLWVDAAVCFVLNRFTGRVALADLQAMANRAFLVEQPLFWAFFVCLLAFLATFARQGWRNLRGA